MKVFDRLFQKTEVREALRAMDALEQSLPHSIGPQLGFEAIKLKLRQELMQNPDRIRRTVQTDHISIASVVLIAARNIVLDELASGHHMTFGTHKTMTGDSLVSLFNHLTDRFERAAIETAEQANEAKLGLRELIKERFG